MTEDSIKVSFIGMDPSDAIKDYVSEKFTKHDYLNDLVTSAEIAITENVPHRGVQQDFKVDAVFAVPNSRLRVEEVGEDVYAMIDAASDKMNRRLRRYHDKQNQWEGNTPWRVLEADEANQQLESEGYEELDSYTDYVPRISVRKKMETMRPMEEAEAIERLELSGYDHYMFKNHATGKVSLVYRRQRGGYGLLEPEEVAD